MFYISSVEAEKNTIIVITTRDPDGMLGEELDNEGIFIERIKGNLISHDLKEIKKAKRFVASRLSNGIDEVDVVIKGE